MPQRTSHLTVDPFIALFYHPPILLYYSSNVSSTSDFLVFTVLPHIETILNRQNENSGTETRWILTSSVSRRSGRAEERTSISLLHSDRPKQQAPFDLEPYNQCYCASVTRTAGFLTVVLLVAGTSVMVSADACLISQWTILPSPSTGVLVTVITGVSDSTSVATCVTGVEGKFTLGVEMV